MSKDDQIKEAYAAIGRFVQEFAHACWALQSLILSTLQVRGGLKDQQMGFILLGNKAMTANTLIDIAQHLVGHISGGQREPIFRDIAKRFRDLNDFRNSLLHGITFVGWGNEQTADWGKFGAFKIASSATGHYVEELPKSADDLEPQALEAREITKPVSRYTGCITGNFTPGNNFILVDGHYRSKGRGHVDPGVAPFFMPRCERPRIRA